MIATIVASPYLTLYKNFKKREDKNVSVLMKSFFTYSYKEEKLLEKDLCQNINIKANVVDPQYGNGVTAWII